MPRIGAGLLMYRLNDGRVEVLLAHPGGPYYRNKDDGAWTIPKGEPDADEALSATAEREFAEETGIVPCGPYIELKPIKQKGGKIVYAWAFAGDCDPAAVRCNLITIEWPPKSGRRLEIPEVDRVAFFSLDEAKRKIRFGQDALLDELAALLRGRER